jgi:hypothetical protein
MSEEKTLTLYQKLLDIQTTLMGLAKDKDTKTEKNPSGYKYVTGSKVLEFIKPLMNKHKLLLKQEILSIDNDRQDYSTKYGTKSEILSKVMMRFTWIDTESGEQDVNLFGANGQNDWEKGLGSALTYAERYFFLKFFHIATDQDDVDNKDRIKSKEIPLKEEEPITDMDWINLQGIFDFKKEKVDANQFDRVKKVIDTKDNKSYSKLLIYLNNL